MSNFKEAYNLAMIGEWEIIFREYPKTIRRALLIAAALEGKPSEGMIKAGDKEWPTIYYIWQAMRDQLIKEVNEKVVS